jgi:hypothetical protein
MSACDGTFEHADRRKWSADSVTDAIDLFSDLA